MAGGKDLGEGESYGRPLKVSRVGGRIFGRRFGGFVWQGAEELKGDVPIRLLSSF